MRGNPFIPIVATIVSFICWAILMLEYTLFWSKSFNWFQSIVVVLVSLAVLGGIIGLIWLSWLFMHGTHW